MAGFCPPREKSEEKEPRPQQESDKGRGQSLNDSGIESPPLLAAPPLSSSPARHSSTSTKVTLDATKSSALVESSSVRPLDEDGWSEEANQLFRELTEDKRLVAVLADPVPPSSSPSSLCLPSWDSVLHVQLIDTNGDSDICIARSLVEAGLAQLQGTDV